MRRVARRRVVLGNVDPAERGRFWLTRDCLPSFRDLNPKHMRREGDWLEELATALGRVSAQALPIPGDCADGLLGAFRRRPRAYLDPAVRAGISVFTLLDVQDVTRGLARLAMSEQFCKPAPDRP